MLNIYAGPGLAVKEGPKKMDLAKPQIIEDKTGNKGLIKDFVLKPGGPLYVFGQLAYVAAQFPDMDSNNTYLVPMSYLKIGPQKVAVTFTKKDLKNFPVLSDSQLPQQITSSQPDYVLISALEGHHVIDVNGKEIGTVAATTLNLPNKSLNYLAIAPSKDLGLQYPLYTVPGGSIKTLNTSNNQVQLNITIDLFKKLKGFDQNNYPYEAMQAGVYEFKPESIFPVTKNKEMIDALKLSMHEEADANRSYLAYAAIARQNGDLVEAKVWDVIGAVELEYHFEVDARMSGMIGTTSDNIQKSIQTQNETISQFSEYAKQAKNQGNSKVAKAFSDLIANEKNRLKTFEKVAKAFQDNKQTQLRSISISHKKIKPVAIKTGQKQAEGKAAENLEKGIKIAAYQHALYYYYGRMAVSEGHPYLGEIFHTISQTEGDQVYPTLSNLKGAVSNKLADNLTSSIGDEHDANDRYVAQAQLAEKLGENTIARQLSYNERMESGHGECYLTLLEKEMGKR